ncbi:MAG: SCP2 sterol-binding domain-containing protein, partial [Gammaproteobacteria bacterium]|nr:SCP2 sterol-binding domain-containing protein [Gammaproteobacteria bacterium]
MKTSLSPRFLLPPVKLPLQTALRFAPEKLLSATLAALFNHLLRGQSLTDRLSALDRRCIAISMTDPSCELRFRIEGGHIASGWGSNPSADWDVRLRGRFEDFWLMATRDEDPDTLFFNRRLAIEGDT